MYNRNSLNDSKPSKLSELQNRRWQASANECGFVLFEAVMSRYSAIKMSESGQSLSRFFVGCIKPFGVEDGSTPTVSDRCWLI